MNVGLVIENRLASVIALYPKIAPQGTTGTHATYHVISVIPTDVKQRASVVDTFRVQISIYADTYAALQTASEAVRTAMDYYQGTISTIIVDLIRFENETDSYEMVKDEYFTAQDYFIRIKK